MLCEMQVMENMDGDTLMISQCPCCDSTGVTRAVGETLVPTCGIYRIYVLACSKCKWSHSNTRFHRLHDKEVKDAL